MNLPKLPWKVAHLDGQPSQIINNDGCLIAELYDHDVAEYIVKVFNDAYFKSKESEHD